MEQRTSKIVLVMYPDCRTTGGAPLEKYKEPISYMAGVFYKTADKLLYRYHREGFSVFGIVFADTTPETYSEIFPFHQFDGLLPVRASIRDWRTQDHQGMLTEVIKQISPASRTKFIVSGFHAGACVPDMVRVLGREGFAVGIDPRMTDKAGFLIMSHIMRKMGGKVFTREDREQDRGIWQTIKREIEFECFKDL